MTETEFLRLLERAEAGGVWPEHPMSAEELRAVLDRLDGEPLEEQSSVK